MSKKQNARKTAPAAETDSCAYQSLLGALSGLSRGFEFPESAREFVTRSTATAKERAAAMHDGAHKVVGGIESVIIDAVTGAAELNRKLIGAAHEDAGAALAAIDKLAGAKSAAEAYQLSVDYWRERGEIGVARGRNATAFLNEKLSNGLKAVQAGVARVAYPRQAA